MPMTMTIAEFDAFLRQAQRDSLTDPASRPGHDRHLAAHHDRAAPEMVGGADALAAEDDAAGREIRTRYDLDEVVDAQRRIVD